MKELRLTDFDNFLKELNRKQNISAFLYVLSVSLSKFGESKIYFQFMTVQTTPLQDCFVLQPKVFEDNRGYFFESYNKNTFKELTGLNLNFVQDNQSSSSFGVIRGLHFQTGAFTQAKLIRVISGKIFDVAVDLRPNSSTYMQWWGVELSAENKLQFYIPRGFAHGFSVLEDNSLIAYKCDQLYNKECESGIYYADPAFDIDWKIAERNRILSERDLKLPHYDELAEKPFGDGLL